MAQVLFHSSTAEVGLVDLVVMEEVRTGGQPVHVVGEPLTVALHFGGQSLEQFEWIRGQLDAWARSMTVVTLNVLEIDHVNYLHLCGDECDVTITIGDTFGLI